MAGGGRLRVYILDEQGKIREQLQKWLSEDRRIGEIKAFDDYARFIEQVGKSPPDFCFIRLGKDGIPGLKAAGMVQRISRDIRIVFLSEDRTSAVDAYEVGAYGYLTCPLDKAKLDKCLIK